MWPDVTASDRTYRIQGGSSRSEHGKGKQSSRSGHRRGSRELKPVSNVTNASQNAIGSEKLEGKLLIASLCQGRLHVWLNLDEDQITHLKLTL